MVLTAGHRIGSYEVVGSLGAGGMGEVYRARDTRLKRDVAIKVLPPEFAANPERLARFQREAELLAAVNHPNIAAIYGLEQSDDSNAIVLELVDGESLDRVTARGPVPLADALLLAQQIVDALEAAHDKGVIHRDLKPANIKVTPDGKVKVLDFGLAAVVHTDNVADINATQSPTLTIAATGAGVILGTAAYMSPEQASGKAADKRADVWAFGVILWEMLTGRRLFDGETISHTLAFVLTKEPDWTALPASTPAAIRRLLRRCLDKDRRRRLSEISSARLEIEDALVHRADEGAGTMPRPSSALLSLGLVAIAAMVGLGAVAIWRLRPADQSEPTMYVDVATPASSSSTAAISPDGTKIVFGAFADDAPQLWIRSLDAPAAKPLPRTERGQFPFWSADSRSIAFYVDGVLKRYDIDSEAVRTLATAQPSGGAWNRDGVILIASATTGELLRLADSGGPPVPLKGPAGRAGRRVLEFLPDQNHFLYFEVRGPADNERGIYLSDLTGSAPRPVIGVAESASYAAGHLFYVRNTTLVAQRFDPQKQLLSGPELILADRVVANSLTTSASGAILYRYGGDRRNRTFAWIDRSGVEHPIGAVTGVEAWSLSPDERTVAMQRLQNGNVDLWTYELDGGRYNRVTSESSIELSPVWSPDSLHVAFSSDNKGGTAVQAGLALYEKMIGSAGSPHSLLAGAGGARATDWSRDGHFLLYQQADPQNGSDIWALPLQGDRKPFPVVRTQFDDLGGQLSADGRWIAYQSLESGQSEVYVQQFPSGAGKVPVSTSGGASVRWGPHDNELFYIDFNARLNSVPVTVTARGTLIAGKPVPLFRTRVGGAGSGNPLPAYAVAKDGQRFLMSTLPEEIVNAPIRMILNWRPPATSTSSN